MRFLIMGHVGYEVKEIYTKEFDTQKEAVIFAQNYMNHSNEVSVFNLPDNS